MRKTLEIKAALACLFACASCLCASAQGGVEPRQVPYENDYCFGLDLSFVRRAEQRGDVFYDTDGSQRSPWEIFRTHGYNWGRLMLCSEPSYLGQGIDNVVENARELKRHGYHFALDYMISDDWSNPMRQPVPKSWEGLSPRELEQKLHDFVYDTMCRLRDEGLMPEIVQIGNEISNGTLWPSGRVFYGEEKKDRSQWRQFTDYLKAGIRAVREADPDEKVQVMLHVDFGGDVNFTDVFFSKMEEYGVEFDLVGYSFYPWSHGTLMDLRDNLAYTIRRFRKPVIVIETGFYSCPSDYFEKKGYRAAFPETPEGQREWMQAVNEIVMAAPDNMGLGVFWWEPMYSGRGFFDDDTHVVKPVVDAFRHYTMPAVRTDGNPRIWDTEE